MPILEYFKKDVRRALEEKLADDSMFRSIRGTCLRVMNDAKEIKLHPTELYYLAFCVIDRMKGQSTSQAEFYSKDEAWYEYDEVLRDIYGGDSDHERHSALALIIQTCAEWLLRSRDMSRLGIVSNLKLQIAYHISEEFSRDWMRSSGAVFAMLMRTDLLGLCTIICRVSALSPKKLILCLIQWTEMLAWKILLSHQAQSVLPQERKPLC